MAIADDFSITAAGDIRYGGAAHGAAGAGYYTVIDFHRWLGDLADDASAAGDDLMDITKVTPSERNGTDNNVGSYISNNNSSFSSINYGYKKLGDLIRASELFDIEMRNNGSAMYIKDNRK